MCGPCSQQLEWFYEAVHDSVVGGPTLRVVEDPIEYVCEQDVVEQHPTCDGILERQSGFL